LDAFWHYWDALLDGCAHLAVALGGILTLGVCADIVLRTVSTGGLPWVFDLVEYGMLFIVALMAAHVLRARKHVEVDLVVSLMPVRVQRWMRTIGGLACFLFTLVLAIAAAEATRRSFVDGSVIFRYVLIPEWVPFAAITLMFALLTVEALRQFIRRWSRDQPADLGRSDIF
jgi:TRAP-type C4-dicarboxylate transport system permease small subunit